MADFKKLLRRNRFSLEILGIVAVAEFIVTQALDHLAPHISSLRTDFLDSFSLIVICAPLIAWRSRAVHGREAQSLSDAVQSSGNAILLLDTQGRIYWVNEGFTRMTGYALDQCLGATPDDLLGSGLTDATVINRLWNSRARAEPCRVEMCNRRKDGQLYWCDIDFRPEFNKRGELVGYIEICTDITELKQSKLSLKAALIESEALRYTVDTHAIVSVADRAGLITEANAAFCAISGYSREEVIGSNHNLLNSGMHPPGFWESMWDDISQGKPWRGEICNKNRLGQLYWVDSMIAPFMGADGLVEKYVSIRTDITARKLLEQDRDSQSRMLAEMVNGMPFGSVVFDENQQLRLHNPQYLKVLRLPPELLAKSPFCFADQLWFCYERGDYGQSESFETLLQGFLQAMKQRHKLDLERRQSDGSYIELHAFPIYNGWTVLTYIDVTERKTQEIALRDAQERVRLATESANIGIWSLNLVTGAETWDAHQFRLFGLPYEPSPNAPVYGLWGRHLHPEDAAQAQAAFQKSIEDKLPLDSQFRIIRPDGAVRYIKALGSPRLDANGTLDFFIGTNQDVTDTVLLNEAMKSARDRAEEANKVKSQFLTNISHEIRTPIHAVMGMLQLIKNTGVNARQNAYVQDAEMATGLMLRIVNDILDYSSLESHHLALNIETFHFNEWLEEIALVMSAGLGEKDINVLLDVPNALPAHLVGDASRLRRVLFCLLDNAIKFTSRGEVVCRISLAHMTSSYCRLAFEVIDTGIGIAPEMVSSIFSDFFQVQSGNTRDYGGVGLGLAVAQRLVQLMGGSIEVQSTLGQGSRFFFTLDLAMPESMPLEPAETTHEVPPHRATAAALVVDACASARDLITTQLTSLYGHSDSADACRQALDLVTERLGAQGEPYSLILLDWNMPDADSWQTLHRMRELYAEQQRAQPVVLMLTNGGNQVLQQRLASSEGLVNGSLAKPFTGSMLRKLVLQVLDAQRESAAAPERSARLRGMRVLVVEDNRINQRVMQNMLVGEGARVWLAEDGQQGVDAIRENLDQQFFDVVLMDLQMPVMDGYQACREIRNSLALKHLPLIAVSANVQAVDRAQSLAAGFNVHIGKPFVLDEVVAVMQQLTNMASATTTGKGANVPHVYWIRNQGQDIVPDAAQLLQQGIALHVLNSIHEWAERTVDDTHSNSLLVVDMDTATSAPMRTLLADNGACIKPGAWLVRSDEATENAMQTSMRAGAVDWAPLTYASEHMDDIVKRHFDAHGELRLDPNNKVVAIDSHAAMTRTISDPGFFGSLLRAFSDELPDRLKGLLEDVVDNPVQFSHRAHSLKGLAATLGLMSLHQIASQAEGMASQAGRISKAQLMVELEGEIQSARFQILRWLDLYGQSVEDIQ